MVWWWWAGDAGARARASGTHTEDVDLEWKLARRRSARLRESVAVGGATMKRADDEGTKLVVVSLVHAHTANPGAHGERDWGAGRLGRRVFGHLLIPIGTRSQ